MPQELVGAGTDRRCTKFRLLAYYNLIVMTSQMKNKTLAQEDNRNVITYCVNTPD
jgi:hypothetical protein